MASKLSVEGRKRFFKHKYHASNYRKIYEILKSNIDVSHKRILLSDIHVSSECLAVTDNEDKLTISSYILRPKITKNSCYVESIVQNYFTYDKKNNKLYYSDRRTKTTSKNKIVGLIRDLLNIIKPTTLKGHRYEWIINDFSLLESISDKISKRVLLSLLNGKITNYVDLYRKVLSERSIKDINYRKLIKKVKKCKVNFNTFVYNCTLSSNCSRDFDEIIKCSDIDEFDFNHHDVNILKDLQNMSYKLGRKINYTWSKSRMKLEHDVLTREIEKIKVSGLKLIEINYKTPPPSEDGIKVLTNNREFLLEGSLLNHCVYTANYFSSACNKNIVIISYDYNNVRGTAEIKIDRDWNTLHYIYKIAQFRGFRNASLPNESEEHLERFLMTDEFKEWFQLNIVTKPNCELHFNPKYVKVELIEH